MIQNDIVLLRALEMEDLDILYAWENDQSLWNVGNTHTPFSKYLLKRYIEESHLDIYQTQQLRLVIESVVSHTTVGMVDLFDFDPYHLRAGIGILIHGVENQRNGFAKNTLQLLIDYCFKILGLHQLYCNINVENHISQHLFESVGFTKYGYCKEWLKEGNEWKDILLYQIITSE